MANRNSTGIEPRGVRRNRCRRLKLVWRAMQREWLPTGQVIVIVPREGQSAYMTDRAGNLVIDERRRV